MASSVDQFKPAIGDRYVRDWIRGGAPSHAWDFKIMSGCALSGIGTAILTIGAGVVACGGLLIDFALSTYAAKAGAGTEYLYFELNENDNSDGEFINYSADFSLNAADSSSADFHFKIAEISTDAVPVLTIINEGKAKDWYARPRIWLMPTMFKSNAPANPVYVDSLNNRFTANGVGTVVIAQATIPPGFKATKGKMYDDAANLAMEFFEANIGVSAIASLGAGNCNTEINITDLSADGTAYIMAVISAVNSTWIFNGYVTLELLAS